MNEAQRPLAEATSPARFDDRTALHLTQAFHHETQLQPLLALLFAQCQALTDARGLRYRNRALGPDLQCGSTERHTVNYNLAYEGDALGELTVFFARRADEAQLRDVEDLMSLAFSALRSAIIIARLSRKRDAGPVQPRAADATGDSLLLLGLDDYPRMRDRDGAVWADTLMTSVHEQIRAGLRTADCVYHIGDDLIAVLMPHTGSEEAEQVAHKIRVLLGSLHLRDGAIAQQLTACMGIASARDAGTADEVMDHAHAALMRARARGRNEIAVSRSDADVLQADSLG